MKKFILESVRNIIIFTALLAFTLWLSDVFPHSGATQCGITYGTIIAITGIYNSIKNYKERKKNEQELHDKEYDEIINEIAGIKCTIEHILKGDIEI